LGNNVQPLEQKTGDFPASSALKIIENCPTLAHVAQVQGNISEPLWRSMLGVVKFTTEGEPLCHEWSLGDPREMPWVHAEMQVAHPTRLLPKFRLARAALQGFNLHHFVAKVGGGVFDRRTG
jgi:hypothetical protein